MRIKQVTVLGGSGFVGSAIVQRLSSASYTVKVLTRRREASKHLILLPNVQVVECDVFDDAALGSALQGADAVINLIGILHESARFSFSRLHIELPRRVAALCASLGITRLLQMSALQAAKNAPSAYLRSKAAGEQAVLAYQEPLHITIFRPSIIFGRGDGFFNLFAGLVKLLPVVLLASPAARFQPVYVEDVAQAFVSSLQNIDTYGQCYELGGPRIYNLKELVQFVALVLNKKPLIIGLNDRLSYWQAFAMELLPIKLMTRDNLASMQVDSVCDDFPALFNIVPMAIEAVVPDYLTADNPRNVYEKFRSYAGR